MAREPERLSAPPSTADPVASPARHRVHSPELGRLAGIFGIWVAVAALYWPSSVALDAFWSGASGEETYTHGYLILLTSLWILWRNRARLAAIAPHPARSALLLVVALSAAWLFLWRAAIQQLDIALLPLLLLGAVAAMFGRRMARALLFPVGFLYFAVPLWGDINGGLQLMSVRANGALMWLTGIPGFMQGDLIQLPGGPIEIAGGCSGLHGFIVGLALGALYGELQEDPPRRRLAWLGLMGALALIANWVRIFVITVVAYETDMRSSLVRNHYWFGWLLFVAAFALFLWLADRLGARWDRAQRPAAASPRRVDSAQGGSRISLMQVAVALGCLGVLPLLAYGRDLRGSRSHAVIAIDWPAAPTGWRGPEPAGLSEWKPAFAYSSAESLERYVTSQGDSVEAFTVAYLTQTQHAKLLGWRNTLVGSGVDLRIVSQRVVDSSAGRWLQTTAIDPAGTRSLIWSRYRIGSRLFLRPRLSQLWYGLAALVGHPVSSLTAFRAVCGRSCDAARQTLAFAVAHLQPSLVPCRRCHAQPRV